MYNYMVGRKASVISPFYSLLPGSPQFKRCNPCQYNTYAFSCTVQSATQHVLCNKCRLERSQWVPNNQIIFSQRTWIVFVNKRIFSGTYSEKLTNINNERTNWIVQIIKKLIACSIKFF